MNSETQHPYKRGVTISKQQCLMERVEIGGSQGLPELVSLVSNAKLALGIGQELVSKTKVGKYQCEVYTLTQERVNKMEKRKKKRRRRKESRGKRGAAEGRE